MFLMAEQYSRELLVEIEGRQAPSPIMRFWRESLQRLSPAQMREGLRLYMKSERGSYKPNPEDIVHNAVNAMDVPVPGQIKDRPVKRIDPNCPECGGSGFRQVEVKSRTRPGSTIQAVADCYCVRIDYAGKTFSSSGKLLEKTSGDRVIARDRVIERKGSTRGRESVPPKRDERSKCAAYDVVLSGRPALESLPVSGVEGAALGLVEERPLRAASGGKNQLGFSPGADHVADNVVQSALASAKTLPRTKPLNDAEYNQRRQMLERQKEKIREESGDRVIR
jgi:hypothetical protein